MSEDKNKEIELEIDIFELLKVLLKKWWLIGLCSVLGAIIAFLFTTYGITPKYKSQAMLYVLNNTTSITSVADFQIGTALTADFGIIAQSKPVVDGAIESIRNSTGKEFTRSDIYSMLSVSNTENTRILVISAISENPENACLVANAVAEQTAAQMANITKSDPPTTVEKAEVSVVPISPSVVKNTIIGFILVAFLVCGILVVAYILNDNIKTEEHVKKYFDVPTLAVIPLIKNKEKKQIELAKLKGAKNDK